MTVHHNSQCLNSLNRSHNYRLLFWSSTS